MPSPQMSEGYCIRPVGHAAAASVSDGSVASTSASIDTSKQLTLANIRQALVSGGITFPAALSCFGSIAL